MGKELTEAILNEVIEGMAIAIVGELVVAGGELLKTLRGDGGEIAGELGVLGEDHRSTSHKAVDQRLLTHHFSMVFMGVGKKEGPLREEERNGSGDGRNQILSF